MGREMVKSPGLPITPSHVVLVQKEHLKSGNCSTCQRKTMYANTLSSALFLSKKVRNRSMRHQRSSVLLLLSCCSVRDTAWHSSEDVPKRTVKQLQNMPRSWLKGKRKLRRQRSFEERDPPLIGKAEHQKAQSASDLWM